MSIHNKRCQVCRDKATAFNYNGLTCHSCKMFFRRNVFRSQKLKCNKKGKCVIDIVTRKRCASCRFEKCVQIGMRSKFVFRLPLRGDDAINSEPKANLDLTAYEWKCVDEIRAAIDSSFVDETRIRLRESLAPLSLLESFNLHANYVRRIIRFCKSISAFRALDAADQLRILKPFYFELQAIRIAFIFDPINDGFRLLANETGSEACFLSMEQFRNIDSNIDRLVELNRKNRLCIQAAMQNDINIRNLIIAQLLFRSRRKISCPEYMKYQNSIYLHLLRRYLEHKHRSIVNAHRHYRLLVTLWQRIDAMRDNVIHMILTIPVDVNFIAEVLREAFNFDKFLPEIDRSLTRTTNSSKSRTHKNIKLNNLI